MFLVITWTPPLLIIITGILLYFVVSIFLKSKQIITQPSVLGNQSILQTNALSADLLPLIEKPFNSIITAEATHNEPDYQEEGWEFMNDEDNYLLKEAEKVVEEIQDTINHVASNPPNPQEVFTKINAIVREYSIFENTEYFEAINSFVAVCVERDCKIKYSKEELLALWN